MKVEHLFEAQTTPEVDAFMKDYWSNTEAHPFSRHLRLWQVPDEEGLVGFEVVPYGDHVGLHFITSFMQKGAGDASKALHWLKRLADSHKVAIELSVEPVKSAGAKGKNLSKANLKAWYARNGFKKTGGDHMRREPNDGT
jgi:hypothetical protein